MSKSIVSEVSGSHDDEYEVFWDIQRDCTALHPRRLYLNFNLSQVSRLGCIDLSPSVGGSLDWPAQRHSKLGVLNVLSLTSTAVILLSARDTGIKFLLELAWFTHMLKSTI
jgi:hypothetical protein